MSNIPAELRYSEDHEWISTSAPWKIGVSDYAQNALGDLTYVELPSVGDTFEKGQEFGTLESTKSVSPLFMPVAGTIKAVNEALVDAPEKVNQDPYGEGWLIEIESAEGVSELLDAAEDARLVRFGDGEGNGDLDAFWHGEFTHKTVSTTCGDCRRQ